MMKFAAAAALLLGLSIPNSVGAKPFERMFPGQRPENREVYQFLRSLDYKQGTVRIPEANATLKISKGFYFLDREDANKVLTQAWGNPSDPATMGMIFPAKKTPLDQTWGAEISYDAIGYVSDADATRLDSDELLQTMREDGKAENAERKKQGYEVIELAGWASPPRYDAHSRKLHWAKELHFEGVEGNTLNYNIRALGRHGVLITNFIGDMSMLNSINAAAPKVMAMTSFEPGARYSDFNPSADTVAAVGIGGLIAGKALSKSGFLLLLLPLLKKFGFLLIIPILWVGRMAFGN